jgi:putative radical SAM enzyme (TIGR03279 family)
MPKGMRETLYFKDDDTRLSFLQGNFVTLTNLSEKEIDRIIRYRISPINVSVHTTEPELRKMMLNNKNAVKIMDYLERLKEGGIEIKSQIVLCPGINDGEHLDKTIRDLKAFYPEMSCIAVVPVGITKYRENLHELRVFDSESASVVISQIKKLQKECLEEMGTRFVFLSDEFYIISGQEFPGYDEYEGFQQLENGVGLVTLFFEEVQEALKNLEHYDRHKREAVIITGTYAAEYLEKAAASIMNKIEGLNLQVMEINNDFFGHGVKVSGLITGRDIISQLKGKAIGGNILIPESMLKQDERIFLDDITVEDIERELEARVTIYKEDGSDLVKNILSI